MHFFIENMISGIPSKPMAVAVSRYLNIYAYVTEDRPWMIELESIEHFSYRKSSEIDILKNGARIYSSSGSYRVTTYSNYEQYSNRNSKEF